MLRLSLTFLACISFLPAARSSPWADGLFQERIKDFGSVPRGPQLRHDFLVKNNTGSLVRITQLRVSCGCVSATAQTSTLRPNESTLIMATMDTTRFQGAKTVTIFVNFDEPRSAEVRLKVRANSRDDVSVNPNALAFGRVKKGARQTAQTTITFLGDNRAQIVQVQCASNYIRPSVTEVSRRRSEVVYTLTAELRADTPVGKWFTDIWLVTNNSSMSRIRVPLTVEIESSLSVSPTSVTFGEIKSGVKSERRIILRGVRPFKVVGVRGAGPMISLMNSTSESRTVHVLTIKLDPTRTGPLNQRLSIVTDLDGNEIDVPTTGTIIP